MNFLDSTYKGSGDGSLLVGSRGEAPIKGLETSPQKLVVFYNKNRICDVKIQNN